MIDTSLIRSTAILDLTVEDNRQHFLNGDRLSAARKWAACSREVLFTEPIPSAAINSTWTYMDMVNISYSYTVKISAVTSILESRMIEQVMDELRLEESETCDLD